MESTSSPPLIRNTIGLPPAPYPPGSGFATGAISLGEVDVIPVSTFEKVWTAEEGGVDNKGATFFKPVSVPEGYSILSYYGRSNARSRNGCVLVIKENGSKLARPPTSSSSSSAKSPPPASPESDLSRLNPLAGLKLDSKEDGASESSKGHVSNPIVEKHLSSKDPEPKADEDQPVSRAAVVQDEPAIEGLAKNATASSGSSSLAQPDDRKSKSLLESTGALLHHSPSSPALKSPLDFRLVWKSSSWPGKQSGNAWVWLPLAAEGYSALGYIVTSSDAKPSPAAVTCVRTDLTEKLAADRKIFSTSGSEFVFPFSIWSTRPSVRGVTATGVNVGSFHCARSDDADAILPISCLKNVTFNLNHMPNMGQLKTVQQFFGPTVVFHPAEIYLPSAVSWFFDSGAMLYHKDSTSPPIRIASDGSNLPQGGSNDGDVWVDIPKDASRDVVKKGNLESAKVHIHVKPVYGATYTDVQSWVFFPFNGAATAKVGKVNIPLGQVGEHVGDWEHYTLRISNFTGELEAVYFSQHSKGQWVDVEDLELTKENRPFVYVAKHGHPCYPHQGVHLQGDERRGVGLRNDTAQSPMVIDSSKDFVVFSAECLHQRGDADAPQEPAWLHYMREWGPKIEYDRKKYIDKLLRYFPAKIREPLVDVFEKLPDEVMGQEGPTGPFEKNMWLGDERS